MRHLRFLVLAAAALISLASAAVSADAPVLMLDTGGHMAMIRSVIFTPDGSQLISASDDKTVRVWDLATGKTVRTIRGETGPGPAGQLFAMALSRDGKWLAVAGWTEVATKEPCCGDIRLYDFASGKLVALLKGHKSAVYGLNFSADGRHLISGSKDRSAIIWDVRARRLKHRLTGHRGDMYGVGFTPDGKRAVTSAFDRELRLWRVADGTEITRMSGHGDKVNTLAISADGTIASGDYSGEIRLWNGETGAFIKSMRQPTMVGSLAFSPDGQRILSAISKVRTDKNPYGANVFDVATGKQRLAYRGHNNTVIAAAVSPDGRWAATGGGNNHEIHVWDLQTGERRKGPDGKPLTLGGVGKSIWSVGIAPDGRIGWGTMWTRNPTREFGPLHFSMPLPSLAEAVVAPRPVALDAVKTFSRALLTQGKWSLDHRPGGNYGYDNAILDIKEGGASRAAIARGAPTGYGHWAYSLADDARMIVSAGANGWMAAHDQTGRKLGNFVGHTSVIWALAPSADGRYLVSGSHDQTVKLWNLQTRELLVTLFQGANGEWVMWTPEGFFVSSEKGASYVGWQINQGPDKEARYVSAGQVRKLFYRPDLVAAKIAGDPSGKIRREATINAVLRDSAAPPEVTIVSTSHTEGSKRTVNIAFKVQDNGGGVGRIELRINGALKGNLFGTRSAGPEGTLSLPVELGATENLIEVVAFNKKNSIQSLPARTAVKLEKKALLEVPDLYILAIGVNDYKDVRRRLDYAVSDATELGRTLADAGASYYNSRPKLTTLTNAEVTTERLTQVFKDLGKKIKATDVFLFFIAGHGKNLRGDYYFVPPGIDRFSEETILAGGFGPKQWQDWFSLIKAEKSVWIFDTCESGSASRPLKSRGGADYDTAHRRLIDATGRIVLMAASDQQLAIEGYHGHGAFTYALLEGLARGDDDRNGYIELMELVEFVDKRVPEISRELKACVTSGRDDYCQRPEVDWSRRPFFALVPRYEPIIAKLKAGAAMAAVPTTPTHVVLAMADLFKGRGGNALRQLRAGDLVTVVKIEENWALVAQQGKAIGYVEKDKLLQMNR